MFSSFCLLRIHSSRTPCERVTKQKRKLTAYRSRKCAMKSIFCQKFRYWDRRLSVVSGRLKWRQHFLAFSIYPYLKINREVQYLILSLALFFLLLLVWLLFVLIIIIITIMTNVRIGICKTIEKHFSHHFLIKFWTWIIRKLISFLEYRNQCYDCCCLSMRIDQ